jgi:probable rRNA maturation factor
MKTVVEIANLTVSTFPEATLKEIAQKILEAEKQKDTFLSIALVGPGRIRKLNKKYRGKNRITDILSFPSGKLDLSKPFSQDLKRAEGLGEVVICPRIVKKNSQRLNLNFEQELNRCLIHGVLHLLGYEHEKDAKSAQKMQEREEFYLKILNPTIAISNSWVAQPFNKGCDEIQNPKPKTQNKPHREFLVKGL